MAKLMAAHPLCHASHAVPLNNMCWVSNHINDFLLAKMIKQNLPVLGSPLSGNCLILAQHLPEVWQLC